MKDSTFTPARTYALVVGIEKYALGSRSDLDGPAHDADTFVGLLANWGVPRENVALLLSPLDNNKRSSDEWPVSSQWPATRQGVSDVVTQWLPKQSGNLLWVFWGGHGVMTATRKRKLFYADTTRADWYHLDLESLLTRLSSDNLPGFQQQIYLIDACANYLRELSPERLGEGDSFSSGEPVRGREQFVFFATQEGEVAKNLDQEQTGLFSKIVLEELAREPSTSWPPDMEKVAERVRDYFSDLAKAGKTTQTPSFISYRTWDGREYVFGKQAEHASTLWNLPFARNPFFTGREDLLERLHTQLQTTQAAALSQPQAISGLGGIGKTQLAMEYAYRYRSEYQAVLWARADTTEALNASYTEIARLLNLPQKDAQEQEVIVQAVKNWLRSREGWLLILDNADDLTLVQPFLPTECPGRLVLTTRAQILGKLARRLDVETLDVEVGALLLLRRAGLVASDASLETASPSDRAIANALTEELGGLPLALDQAGAYIEETQCGLADYQHQYQTRRAELLAHRGMLVDDHPEPVATTWSLSFAKVEAANSTAAEVLRICAFLAPDAIPEELLVEALKTPLPTSETPKKPQGPGGGFSPVMASHLDEAVALLRTYSLIQRNGRARTISIHRLVQAVIRDAIEEQTAWITRAIGAVNRLFPAVSFATWERCERYLLQALACATWIVQRDLFLLEGASLLLLAGHYLFDRGQYTQAEPLSVRALSIFEQKLGAEHPITAQSLNGLALLYASQGKYAQAEPLYVRALSIFEQQLRASHLATATSLNNLAELYRSQGKYAQAEPLYVRALSIFEQQLGAEHPTTAQSLNNLANLYASQKKYAQAESLYVRALAIDEQKSGAKHPATATSLNNLASLYKIQGKYAQAEPLLVRALSIYEQLGAKHPDTATSLNNLALLYASQEKYAQAEPLLVRALAIDEQELGAEHPDTALSLTSLASLYASQEKYAQAEPLYVRALAILDPNHPSTQTVRANYAALLRTMEHKKNEEAGNG